MHKMKIFKGKKEKILPCHLALEGWGIFQNGVTLACICQVHLLKNNDHPHPLCNAKLCSA